MFYKQNRMKLLCLNVQNSSGKLVHKIKRQLIFSNSFKLYSIKMAFLRSGKFFRFLSVGKNLVNFRDYEAAHELPISCVCAAK